MFTLMWWCLVGITNSTRLCQTLASRLRASDVRATSQTPPISRDPLILSPPTLLLFPPSQRHTVRPYPFVPPTFNPHLMSWKTPVSANVGTQELRHGQSVPYHQQELGPLQRATIAVISATKLVEVCITSQLSLFASNIISDTSLPVLVRKHLKFATPNCCLP